MHALNINCGAISPSPARIHAVRGHASAGTTRRLRHTLDPTDGDYVDGVIVNGARHFPTEPLAASTVDDLQFSIAELAASREFIDFHEYLCRIVLGAEEQDGNVSAKPRERFMVLCEGATEVALLDEALRLLQVEDRIAPDLRQSLVHQRMPRSSGSSLFALLESITTPHEYVTAVRGALRSNAAQLALVELESQKREGATPPRWLVRGLLRTVIDGTREHLRLAAGVPGVEVDEVAEADRIDWERLVDRWDALSGAVDRMYGDAAASGQSVYRPFEGTSSGEGGDSDGTIGTPS